MAHPVPYRCQVHTPGLVPVGEDPGPDHRHAAQHDRAHRREVFRLRLRSVRAAQVAVGDQRQPGQRGRPGEQLVAGPAFESLLEEPRVQNHRVRSSLLQHPQPFRKPRPPFRAFTAQPDFCGEHMRPESAHLAENRPQGVHVLKQSAAGGARERRPRAAGQVQVQRLRPRLSQPIHNPFQWVTRSQHELIDHAPFLGAAAQPGRRPEVLAQDLPRRQHLRPHRAAAAQFRHQPPEGTVRVTDQRRAKARRGKTPASDDTLIEQRLPGYPGGRPQPRTLRAVLRKVFSRRRTTHQPCAGVMRCSLKCPPIPRHSMNRRISGINSI